jgi:hypothetical protein
MATIAQIRKRIDKIEQRRNPPQVLKPPFGYSIPPTQPRKLRRRNLNSRNMSACVLMAGKASRSPST